MARAGYHPPVLALGGVAAENIDLLPAVGFAGAAVLGSIWQGADPVAALRQLQTAIGRSAAYASAASQSFHTGS
jgi:thiamine monophosphate synthase